MYITCEKWTDRQTQTLLICCFYELDLICGGGVTNIRAVHNKYGILCYF